MKLFSSEDQLDSENVLTSRWSQHEGTWRRCWSSLCDVTKGFTTSPLRTWLFKKVKQRCDKRHRCVYYTVIRCIITQYECLSLSFRRASERERKWASGRRRSQCRQCVVRVTEWDLQQRGRGQSGRGGVRLETAEWQNRSVAPCSCRTCAVHVCRDAGGDSVQALQQRSRRHQLGHGRHWIDWLIDLLVPKGKFLFHWQNKQHENRNRNMEKKKKS